ncbi:PIKK family atypical protein kinase [Histomonas meleagridis]|uniref:PIKK family atypical protein kinase n=1 Tax=Histomonas meleagridis TaxID=135588 RepID=UPI00355A31FB|nr:PIKK family atypical protein kinase [Histomonas meleagridis]KAH0797646.1 PIKK family atypical protein kinase [Histomonas meleagridis]
MGLIGSNGRKYDFLLKANEDTRLDERVMQFFTYVNTIISSSSIPLRKNLSITTYSVTPITGNVGLIGWVTGCDTMFAIIKEYRDFHSIDLEVEYKIGNPQNYGNFPIETKMQFFRKGIKTTKGDEVKKILFNQASDSINWLERRKTYTTSLALTSIAGYILGLGDRHMQNIMFNLKSAKLVHIDFGDCFEVTQHRKRFPELVPFRLTRLLVNALEVTRVDGTFRVCCENIMKILRRNNEQILGLLDVFIYDPLLQWIVEENNSDAAVRVVKRIEDKLKGNDFEDETQLSVQAQVNNLIKQATDIRNLCQMFPGWYPWW